MITDWMKKGLLWVARIKILGAFVGLLFEYASGVLPLNRRAENTWAICFDHPVPAAPFHLLAIPKRRTATLIELAEKDQDEALDGLLRCIEDSVSTRNGAFRI